MHEVFMNVKRMTYPPMTNADKIRSMSNEELAEFLDGTQYREWEEIKENEDELNSYRSCVNGWLAWLEQPYEGE